MTYMVMDINDNIDVDINANIDNNINGKQD